MVTIKTSNRAITHSEHTHILCLYIYRPQCLLSLTSDNIILPYQLRIVLKVWLTNHDYNIRELEYDSSKKLCA